MKNIHIVFVIVLSTILLGCNDNNSNTEKYQMNRDYNIIDVSDKITDLPNMLPVRFCTNIKIINNLLIIMDSKATHKGIHIYNKNSFKHLATTGYIGKGPGEIVNYGNIVPLKNENAFLLPDYGKLVITKFYIDSILNDSTYKPIQIQNFAKFNFCTEYESINDTIFLGMIVNILKNRTFRKCMAKYNIITNKMEQFGYHHPISESNDRKKTYFRFKIFPKNNIYVRCYSRSDLITICDLDGNLKYNIYGPGWKNNKNNRKDFFTHKVEAYNKYIITSYLGKNGITFDENKRPHGVLPTKFLVFDFEGNYIKTIETNHHIANWGVDEDNKRIIAYFDDIDVEFGYINIDFLDKL